MSSKYDKIFKQYEHMFSSKYITKKDLLKKIVKEQKLSSVDYLAFVKVCKTNNIDVVIAANSYNKDKSPISSLFDMDIFSDFKNTPEYIIDQAIAFDIRLDDILAYLKINELALKDSHLDILINAGYRIKNPEVFYFDLALLDTIPAQSLKDMALSIYTGNDPINTSMANGIEHVLKKCMDNSIANIVENKILEDSDLNCLNYTLWAHALDIRCVTEDNIAPILNKIPIRDPFSSRASNSRYSISNMIWSIMFDKKNSDLLGIIKVKAPDFWNNTGHSIFFFNDDKEQQHYQAWYSEILNNNNALSTMSDVLWVLYDDRYDINIREKAFSVALQKDMIDTRVIRILLKEFKNNTSTNSGIYDACVLYCLKNIKTMSHQDKKEILNILPGITTAPGRKKIISTMPKFKFLLEQEDLYDLKTIMTMALQNKRYNDLAVELPVFN